MPKKFFSSAMAAALAVTMFGVQDTAVDAAEGDFDLTIMHTNDTHAHLNDVAKRVTLVEQIRGENPNNLLLDAGDVFSGTLFFNKYQGQADLQFMNLMQYDAMTFGNHEFDLGSTPEKHEKLAEFVSRAEFPFVSANVDFSADPNMAPLQNDLFTYEAADGQIYNGIVKEFEGEQVGIFGLTTEETANISSPGDITFSNYITAAEEAVAWFEAQGVNKIVALTHIGFDDNSNVDNDQMLAESVDNIDVIVGGHTHSELKAPVVVKGEEGVEGDTVIVQAGQHGTYLGQLDVTFDEAGEVVSASGLHHKVSDAEEDADTKVIIDQYKAEIKEMEEQEIGASAEVVLDGSRFSDNGGVFYGVRQSETNLGNLITDGMLAAAQEIDPDTVIALQNGGGIRSSIDEGPITLGEVLEVMPYGNALAIMEISGAELKEALEISVGAQVHENDGGLIENGGFLHASGLHYSFDFKAPAGDRIAAAYVVTEAGPVPVEDDTMYKVATNTFTAKGGDGYDVFAEAYAAGRVIEPGNIDYQMFIDHVVSLEEVAPEEEGRIIQLRMSDVNRYETAVQVSQQGWESSDVVLIAQGNLFADALTAAPLAYNQAAPILLTGSDSLNPAVKAEIQRLGASKAIIIGGAGAISKEVELEIRGNLTGGQAIERIGGKDRYETAKLIAARLGGTATEAVIVNGQNFPDALSASSFAASYGLPILLTRTDSIPAATQDALEGIGETVIVGGTGAVSENVKAKLPNASRVGGKDRYETSAKVAEEFFPDSPISFAANGRGFADALTGSALASIYDAPVLLVKADAVTPEVADYASYTTFDFATGGSSVVSPEVVKELNK